MLGGVKLCGGNWVLIPRGQLTGTGGRWKWVGGGPEGGVGELLLLMVLVRLCSCWAF